MPPKVQPRCRPCSAISIPDHLDWAAGIAATVARKHGFYGQERAELISVAHLTVCELEPRFDPSRHPEGSDLAGAFRGWAYQFVVCACRREAQRLRGGGLFHTIRPELLFAVKDLGETAVLLADEEPVTVTERPTVEPTLLTSNQNRPCYGRRLAEGGA